MLANVPLSNLINPEPGSASVVVVLNFQTKPTLLPAGPIGPPGPKGTVNSNTFAVSGPLVATAKGPVVIVGVPTPAAAPVEPVLPCIPCEPCGPVLPVEPVEPVGPVGPCEPVGPVGPVFP